MSTPEQDLERTLRRRATRAGGAPLSLETVQRRARRIRRRRTTLAVGVAAASVAVVVPLGVTLGGRGPSPEPPVAASTAPATGAATDSGGAAVPTYTVLGEPPADQTTEAALPVPYWLDGTLVSPDGTTVRLDSASDAPLDQIVREPDGGWSGLQRGADGTLLRLHVDATGSVLAANATQASVIGVTPDGSAFAYLADRSPDGTAGSGWRLTRGGAAPMTWAVPEVTGDSGVAGLLSDGTVVVTTEAGRVRLARSSGSLDDLPGGYLKATSVATGTDRIAVQISSRDDGTSCWAVVTPTGAREARTCTWQLIQFSPDGRYLLGATSQSDGTGLGELVVLDATTLRPVARFDIAGDDYFGSSVWSGDQVVTTAYVDGTWRLALLSLDGVRQVRGLRVSAAYGDRAPIGLAAGPLDN